MISIILVGLAVLAVYCLICLLSPTRGCPRCRGTRVGGSGRKIQACTKCKGTGRTRRIGATAVHRFVWSIARRDDN